MNNQEFDKNTKETKDEKEVIELVVDNGKKPAFSTLGVVSFFISILLVIALGLLYFMMQNELANVKALSEKQLLENEAKISMNESKHEQLYNENKKQLESLTQANKKLQDQVNELLEAQNQAPDIAQEPIIDTPIENEAVVNQDEYYMINKPKVPKGDDVTMPQTPAMNQEIPQIPAQPELPQVEQQN